MQVTGRTLVFGLIGHPVRHSLSPAIHNRLFQQMGVDALYAAFDVNPSRADSVADAIRTLDLRGVNLTVPFKGAILPKLDRVTRAAAEAAACNVVIQHEGFLTGYNTDGEGFCRGFEDEFGHTLAGRRAMVIGAGGAGRAIGAALADRGAAEVTFMNRTAANAAEAVAALGGYFEATAFRSCEFAAGAFAARAPEVDLVVNCTTGAASETVRGFDVYALRRDCCWCDINYWDPDPPLLAVCRARGLSVQDGLAMLIHQGALSFELFTGVPVSPDHIRGNLR